MKRILTFALALTMTLSLAACGQKGEEEKNEVLLPTDALTMLTTAWDAIPEDDRFPAGGGDAENPVDGAPGVFGTEDVDYLSYMLTVPAELADKIDGAASLVHMMNLNSFTCGAFHLTSADDVESFAQSMRDAIASKQWMCGFPDKLVVLTLGEYVVSMYGLNDNIDTFRDKLVEAYPDTVVAFDETIA